MTKSYEKGQRIFLEGDPGDALYIVQSGFVKIYRIAEDGREKTLALFAQGDFFGDLSLLDGQPRSAMAEALEKSTLFVLYRHDFLEMMDANPGASQVLIKELASRLRRTNTDVMDMVFLDVRTRVARTLLHLAERHGTPGDEGVRIDLKLTHKELASIVGTARETVTRILADLQDEWLLTFDGRYIVLRDPDKMQASVSAG